MAEFFVAAVFAAALVVLNLVNVFHRRFDSDEMGHLHVIWSWTRGLVQYRDIFDNHMPLFHLVFAPIAAFVGERASILYAMRLALLPMWFVAAWCTYRLGAQLYSRRVGVWAALTLGFFSPYHLLAFQFRTDNLWTAIWLLCVAHLLCGAMTLRRWLVAGLLLGLCFGVSMKSTVLLLSCAVALFAWRAAATGKSALTPNSLIGCAMSFVAASALVPGAIASFFAWKGVWSDFRYGVYDFNLLANRIYRKHLVYITHPGLTLTLSAAALIAGVYIARRIIRDSDSERAFGRVFVLLVSVFYFLLFKLFWPPISRTYLGLYPLLFVTCMGGVFAIERKLSIASERWKAVLQFVPAAVVVAEIVILLCIAPVRKNRTQEETNLLRNVLKLTDRSDYIFDSKGETVFRTRCFWPVLEAITVRATRAGILPDNAPQRCIETHTCVVATILRQRFSPAARRFVERNYLPVAKDLSVAGTVLHASATDPHHILFNVVVPAEYEIISLDSTAAGTLDGTAYSGARFLSAGGHDFESSSASARLILLWAQAADRHYMPLVSRYSRHG